MNRGSEPSIRHRPSERVRHYILHQLSRPGVPDRLPTMRDLAAHLDVSLATVQNVYRDLKTEGRIATRAGGGTCLVRDGKVAPAPAPPPARRRIYFNRIAQNPGSGVSLLGSYYGALLQTAMQRNLCFDFSVLDARQPEAEQARALFESGELAGMILFPFVPCQPLFEVCDKLGIPYVSIHPPNPQTQANFVTPDFFMGGFRMGEAFVAGGRREVAYFTLNPLMESSTAWAFTSGLQNGLLTAGGRAVVEHVHLSRRETKMDDLRTWLKGRKRLPDAILCHWHALADTALECLDKMNIAVPEEVGIISPLPDHTAATSSRSITRALLPAEEVSAAAFDLLQRRMELQGVALPGIRVPHRFTGGDTTLPAENLKLGL
ncbi:MAG TPA: substrate-binding domain-containing protein [Chthoniobacteraceae bacterium]|nr:substrate-binding domain-containing protein [Chthoniobacteraceae bacterium]